MSDDELRPAYLDYRAPKGTVFHYREDGSGNVQFTTDGEYYYQLSLSDLEDFARWLETVAAPVQPLTAEGPTGPEGIAGAIGHQGPLDSYFAERLYGPAAPHVLEVEKELRAAHADLGRTRRENTELRDLLEYALDEGGVGYPDNTAAKRIRELLAPR